LRAKEFVIRLLGKLNEERGVPRPDRLNLAADRQPLHRILAHRL